MSNEGGRHKCPACGKHFKGKHAVADHLRDKHKSRRNIATDHEPSMADLMIEAQLNRAMGIANEDWIEDMLP